MQCLSCGDVENKSREPLFDMKHLNDIKVHAFFWLDIA